MEDVLVLILRQQSKGLPLTNRQHRRGGHHRTPPGHCVCQHGNPLEIPSAHLNQPIPDPQDLRLGSRTEISIERLQRPIS